MTERGLIGKCISKLYFSCLLKHFCLSKLSVKYYECSSKGVFLHFLGQFLHHCVYVWVEEVLNLFTEYQHFDESQICAKHL